jgi:hypothetical protein
VAKGQGQGGGRRRGGYLVFDGRPREFQNGEDVNNFCK